MAGPREFRRFADLCVEMANGAASDRRSQLMDMADTWRRLAAEAERFEELVRDLDQAFDAPRPNQEMRQQRRSH